MSVKKNSGSLYRTFLSASLITGVVSVLVGLFFAYQSSKISMEEQEAAKDANYASTISLLLQPSLKISNYREVQNILGRLNNEFYEHAVIDGNGEILLADFTSYALIRDFVPKKQGLRCDDLPKRAEYKFAEPARIVCSSIAPDEGQVNGQGMGLLVVLRRAPSESISMKAFGVLFGAFVLTILLSLGI